MTRFPELRSCVGGSKSPLRAENELVKVSRYIQNCSIIFDITIYLGIIRSTFHPIARKLTTSFIDHGSELGRFDFIRSFFSRYLFLKVVFPWLSLQFSLTDRLGNESPIGNLCKTRLYPALRWKNRRLQTSPRPLQLDSHMKAEGFGLSLWQESGLRDTDLLEHCGVDVNATTGQTFNATRGRRFHNRIVASSPLPGVSPS